MLAVISDCQVVLPEGWARACTKISGGTESAQS